MQPAPTILIVWVTWLVVTLEPSLADLGRMAERVRNTASSRLPTSGRPLAAPAGAVIRPRRD
jgi:hypothetical protein